jgi:hypothetical protein
MPIESKLPSVRKKVVGAALVRAWWKAPERRDGSRADVPAGARTPFWDAVAAAHAADLPRA